MSLRYILGRSGTGKTTLCFNEILENNRDENKNALIYIVPEQFSLQSEKNIIEKSGLDSIIRIHVLSFKRLAYYIFSETGMKAGKILEDTGKFILLRKIISDLKDQFKFYENPNITKGFIEKISEAITEFYEYNVSIEELTENAAGDEKLLLKIHDLGLIYEKFLEFLGENYISTDETLDILSGKIHQSNFLKEAKIWIDGFSSFTPQEMNVIKSLLERTAQVNISLTSNSPYVHFNHIKRTDIFYETKETIIKLQNLASESGVKIERPTYLKLTYRYLASAELKYLEENYFNYSALAYDGVNRRVKTFGAKNRYDEVIFTADYIIHMVRENNYKFSDIAVITSEIEKYESIIRPVFALYEIPFFIDSNEDLLNNPVTEFIRALLDIYVRNWSCDSVLRFLRTGMTELEIGDIDLLENYLIEYGIKGYQWGQDSWYYGFSNPNNNYDSGQINGIRSRIQELLFAFHPNIQFKDKLTVKDFSKKIYRFLNQMSIKDKIHAIYEAYADKGNMVAARQYLQIWDIIKLLFEKLVEIMGDEEIGIQDFAAILDSGLYSQNLGTIPNVQDQLIVGDLIRSRVHNIKALFIIGANEGAFPNIRKETGIFTDEERKKINENGIEIAPDSISRTFQDNFILYSSITKAESILTLTYPLSEINGKALFPASAVLRINKLFNDGAINDLDAVSVSVPQAMFEKALVMIKNNTAVSEIDKALIHWFKEHEDYRAKIEHYLSYSEGIGEDQLSFDTISRLYSDNIKTSISRLEKYIQCPFAFFVEYNLEARERQAFKVQRVDLGNLFHYILEEFSALISIDHIQWASLTEKQILFYTEKAFNIFLSEIESNLFEADERNRYILVRVKRIAERSIWALCQHIKKGSFTPYGAEVDFGLKSPLTGIVIEIDEKHQFTLTGRIDRIDIMDHQGKAYVKIIDYKSGNKKFDVTDVYYGMQLQLLLYMKSIIEKGGRILRNSGELLPGGVLYFKLDDPVINLDTEKTKEEIENLILEKYKMSGLILEDEEVIRAMDKDIDRSSSVIPVAMLAKGGVSRYKSSVADSETFNAAMDYAVDKVQETGRKLVQGNIEAKPFKKGSVTGCSYCSYNVICGFETLTKDNTKYNVFRKKSGMDIFRNHKKNGGE